MASLTKFYIMTGVGIGLGAVSLGIGLIYPNSYESNALVTQSKETTELTANTASTWTAIPGSDDIEITWMHTLYNLTNFDQVSAIDYDLPDLIECRAYS
jgi:hypothetical protein